MQRRISLLILLLMLSSLTLSSGLMAGVSSASAAVADPALQDPTDEVVVVRVYYNTVEDIERLVAFDVFEYNNLEERYVLAAVDGAELESLRDLGFRAVIDPEETANFARLSIPLAEQPQEALGPEAIPGYSCYRTVEETYQTAQDIVAAHPTLATWTDAGNSWEKSAGQPDGYDMMLLTLTNSAVAGTKPKLFITASIHAREYTPAELTTRFAEYLVDNYGTDADATWLLDHHEIHLMLHANPDGRKEAEAGASWRKNTNENYCGPTSSNRGADLNRNFSYMWGCCNGSSGSPCDSTYRGPSAASEPETQAIQNHLTAIFPDQRGTGTAPAPADATGIYLDMHSAAGLVIWPWGYTRTDPPNVMQLRTLGRKFAYFNGYAPNQIADQLYIADGGSIDYSYGELGIASYAFELGTQFFQDCNTFNNTIVPNNLPALVYAAKVVRMPYQTPLGPDALSLAVAPHEVTGGDPATLTATINDTRYSTRNGTESTQNIAAAEYYIDTPPWQGGMALAMTAADGSYNSAKTENVTATVETTGLAEGRHILFVRGQDASGNWGAFSAIFLDVAAPAAVNIASFTAAAAPEGVTLAWETVSETGNAGFNVYRSESDAGPWTQVNATLIPAKAPGSAEGQAYTWTDASAEAGMTYFYQLEDVALSGETTRHDPVSVALMGPNAVGLAGFGAAAATSGPALAGLAGIALAALAGAGLRRRR